MKLAPPKALVMNGPLPNKDHSTYKSLLRTVNNDVEVRRGWGDLFPSPGSTT